MMDSGGSLEAPDASRHHQVMSAQGEAPRVNGVEDVRPSGSHESGATGTTAGDGNQGQGKLALEASYLDPLRVDSRRCHLP